MTKHDAIDVYYSGDAEIGVLPFSGRDVAMLVILPSRFDGLPALEGRLTAPNFAAWLAGPPLFHGEKLEVSLPKFAVTSTLDLAAVLATLGVTDAFDPSIADFSGIDGDRDLVLDQVRHQATITVDEQGAEAVAATGSTVTVVLDPPPFTADHPFVFVIYDEVTGAILFMGRVTDPAM